MEKSKETRRYLQTGVVKNPTPLHEDYLVVTRVHNIMLLVVIISAHCSVITLYMKHLSSCSGVGFFYNTSLQVPSCFFTFFHFNPTTFPFLMFFIYLL